MADFLEPEKESLIASWQASALEDFQVAKELFASKHYSHALFYCQLAVEKVLKALFIKVKDTYPPPIHNLVKLAEKCDLKLDQSQTEFLTEITTFNVEARYDVIKQGLYKKATLDFTQKYMKIVEELLKFFSEKL